MIVQRFFSHRWVPVATTLTVLSFGLLACGELTQSEVVLNLAVVAIVAAGFFWGAAQSEHRNSRG